VPHESPLGSSLFAKVATEKRNGQAFFYREILLIPIVILILDFSVSDL
jgi:hypothetical protein